MEEQTERSGQLEALTRGAEHVVPADDLAARLAEGRRLRVKLGVDPTARDITLGWAMPLRKLRAWQDHGHTAVLVLGDFTARIGDPSGKSATRPELPKEVVRANAEACLGQLLDILSEDNLEVRYNSEWLEPLDLPQVLRLTSQYTVAQMLERADFPKRYKEGRPISIVELMYPLLQAYDSVAVEADVELGGSDQLFNLLVGRDLQSAYGQRPQVALTMPLLIGLDGAQKMSQSLNNYIAIRAEPDEMFGKLMSLPDDLVVDYARLGTDLSESEIAELGTAVRAGGPRAGAAKRAMARAVVSIYHGAEAAAAAEESFDRRFRLHEAPEDVPESPLPAEAVNGDRVKLPAALAGLGLASSRGDARRLLAGGAVRIDGRPVADEEVDRGVIEGAVVQVGKRRFVRVVPGRARRARV